MTAHSPATAVSGGPTLTTYVDFVRRYRLLLTAAVILALCAGAILHATKPQRFTSSADMVVVATAVVGGLNAERDVSIDSALQLLRSDRVIGHVAREIDYPGGPLGLDADVTTRPVVNSRIVRLSVDALDPRTAQEAVTAVVERFYTVRQWGLQSAARNRAEVVEAELEAVESELARRYGLATDAQLPADPGADIAERPMVDIGGLVELRAQLYGEQAALAIAEPNPGYVSRPPTTPTVGTRAGLAVTLSSALTVSLLAAVVTGAALDLLRGRRTVDRHPTRQGALHGTA